MAEVTRSWTNQAFAVLSRPVDSEWGVVEHLMIRTLSNADITWAEKQRIKNELVGEGRTAIEVFPAEVDLVDGADMYHLWVLPSGAPLPFGLHR